MQGIAGGGKYQGKKTAAAAAVEEEEVVVPTQGVMTGIAAVAAGRGRLSR
jgi:hypothetical protein